MRTAQLTARLIVTLIALVARVGAETGDCNDDGAVSINELVTCVRISLGETPAHTCAAADRNRDGRVTIDELVAAVRVALTDHVPQRRAFVVTTNFTAGSYATVDLEPPRAVTSSSSQRRVHRDAVARTHGGIVYVINRLYGDNIQALDPADGFRTLYQCSTGNGSNPHDIAFASHDKAYVTLFEETELLVVNPAPRPDCSDFVRGSIDLAALADDDGTPDMDQMRIVGDRLYVVLQRLDLDTVLRLPAGPGAIAVIDTTTDRLIDTIELIGENPFGATKGLTQHGSNLYIAAAGLFGTLDGGIERVGLRTNRSGGFIVTEAALGGDITDFVLVASRRGYAVVSQPGFTTALVAFDPSDGTLLDTILRTDGYTLFDIELNDRGELYVADRDRGNDGLRIFDAATGTALVDEPIDLGLAPFEIVFIE